jgi:hypothetical protein
MAVPNFLEDVHYAINHPSTFYTERPDLGDIMVFVISAFLQQSIKIIFPDHFVARGYAREQLVCAPSVTTTVPPVIILYNGVNHYDAYVEKQHMD